MQSPVPAPATTSETDPLVDESAAGIIVGRLALFQRMVEHGWIKPVVSGHRCTLYAEAQVQACCDLLDQGHRPGEKNPERAVIRGTGAGPYV